MPKTTARDFCKDPDRRAAFLEWLENPMTKAVFELAEDNARLKHLATPPPVGGTDSVESTALLYAISFGRLDTLDFIQNLDAWAMSPAQLEATYGSDKILSRDFGYPSPTTKEEK